MATPLNLLGKTAQVPGVMLWICLLTSKTEDFGESYGPNGMKIYKHQINWMAPLIIIRATKSSCSKLWRGSQTKARGAEDVCERGRNYKRCQGGH